MNKKIEFCNFFAEYLLRLALKVGVVILVLAVLAVLVLGGLWWYYWATREPRDFWDRR